MNKLQVVLVFDPQFFYPMLLLAKNALTIGRIFLVSTKRKCIDMSMENNYTDVRVYRKKTHQLQTQITLGYPRISTMLYCTFQ